VGTSVLYLAKGLQRLGGGHLRLGIALLAYTHSWKDRIRVRVGRSAAASIANSQGGIDYWKAEGRGEGLYLIRNGMHLDGIRGVSPVEITKWGIAAEALGLDARRKGRRFNRPVRGESQRGA
jgi:hypothetical protein